MKKFITRFLLTFLLSMFFSSCDTDKYFGYNYETEKLSEFVNITGKITNAFTTEAVKDAQVNFEGQIAITDEGGNYQLQYVPSGDEQYNRPVQVTVSAEKYIPFSTSLLIYPRNNHLDASLEYGAPIILESSFAASQFTARVFDYQGVYDIAQVLVIVRYYNNQTGVSTRDSLAMDLIQVLDENTGEFWIEVSTEREYGTLSTRGTYKVFAIDHSGYQELKEFVY